MGGYEPAVHWIGRAGSVAASGETAATGDTAVSDVGVKADNGLLAIAGVAMVVLALVAIITARGSGSGRRAQSRPDRSDRRASAGEVSDRLLDDLWHRAGRLEDDLERQHGALRSVDSSLARVVARPSGIDVGVVRELTSLRNEVARLTSQAQQSARDARRLADALQG